MSAPKTISSDFKGAMWASHPTISAVREQSVGVDDHIDPRSEKINKTSPQEEALSGLHGIVLSSNAVLVI